MRTGITQRKRPSLLVAANHQRLFEKHRRKQFAALDSVARQRAVPEAEEHQRIRRLLYKWRIVGHSKAI